MQSKFDRLALGVVIIAAGQGSRFGGNKLLLEHPSGQPLLHYVVQQYEALCAEYMSIISGAYHAEIKASFCIRAGAEETTHNVTPKISKVNLVQHAEWQQGMGTSIAVGVKQALVDMPHLTHIMIGLADQPLITTSSLARLTDHINECQPRIIISEWQQQAYPPMIFSKYYFAQLSRLSGDLGARAIVSHELKNCPERCVRVPHPQASVDIDTPQDYARLK